MSIVILRKFANLSELVVGLQRRVTDHISEQILF